MFLLRAAAVQAAPRTPEPHFSLLQILGMTTDAPTPSLGTTISPSSMSASFSISQLHPPFEPCSEVSFPVDICLLYMVFCSLKDCYHTSDWEANCHLTECLKPSSAFAYLASFPSNLLTPLNFICRSPGSMRLKQKVFLCTPLSFPRHLSSFFLSGSPLQSNTFQRPLLVQSILTPSIWPALEVLTLSVPLSCTSHFPRSPGRSWMVVTADK